MKARIYTTEEIEQLRVPQGQWVTPTPDAVDRAPDGAPLRGVFGKLAVDRRPVGTHRSGVLSVAGGLVAMLEDEYEDDWNRAVRWAARELKLAPTEQPLDADLDSPVVVYPLKPVDEEPTD